MRVINIIITILILSQICRAYKVVCPKISYTAVSFEIKSKISFNKNNSLYKYEYTFKNNASSLLPISRVRMETIQNVQSVKAINNWELDYNPIRKEILWGANVGIISSLIQPGATLSGFEFESPNPPGIIKFAVAGWKTVNDRSNFPRIIFVEGEIVNEDEARAAYCPGENFEHRKPEIIGIAIGPIPPDIIVAKLRLKKMNDKKWQGAPNEDEPTLVVSPLDTDKIQLILFDDENIDVSKIDLNSIKFGPGKALPVKTEFKKYIDEEKDNEITEHLKKHNKNHLLMEFNIADLKVECDIDRALFFKANMGDKKLSGAVKIKHTLCSEMPKKVKAKTEAKKQKH